MTSLEEFHDFLLSNKSSYACVIKLYDNLKNDEKLEILSDSGFGLLILDKLISDLPNSQELLKKLFFDPNINDEIKLKSILTPPDNGGNSDIDSQSFLQLILQDKLLPKLTCFLEIIPPQLLEIIKQELPRYGVSQLHLAVIKDDIEDVEKIMETSIAQIERNSSFFVLLACRNGSEKVLKKFIERGYLKKYFDEGIIFINEGDGIVSYIDKKDVVLDSVDPKDISTTHDQDNLDDKKASEDFKESSVFDEQISNFELISLDKAGSIRENLMIYLSEFGHENVFAVLVEYLRSNGFDFAEYPSILVNAILKNNSAMVKAVIDAIDREKIDSFITSQYEILIPQNYFLALAMESNNYEVISAILNSLSNTGAEEYLFFRVNIEEAEYRIFDYGLKNCSDDIIMLLISKIKNRKEELFLSEDNITKVFSPYVPSLQVLEALTDSLSEDKIKTIMLANFASILKTNHKIIGYFLSRFQDKQAIIAEIMSRKIGFLHYIFDGYEPIVTDDEEISLDQYLPRNEEEILKALEFLFEGLDNDCKRNLLQATNEEGNNILHRAFAGGLSDVCKFIIDQFKSKDRSPETCQSDQQAIYDFLMLRNSENNTPIELGMVSSDQDKTRQMIDLFFVEFSDDLKKTFLLEINGSTLLNIATAYLNNVLITYSLDCYSSVNQVPKHQYLSLKDNQGDNSLHLLMCQEVSPIIETLKILLESVGDDHRDNYLLSLGASNINALQLAISYLKTEDQFEVVKLLLNSHSNRDYYMSLLDSNGNNCLLLTIFSLSNPSDKWSKIKIANFLLSIARNKAELIYQKNTDNINAFELVIQEENYHFMKLFYEHGLLRLDSEGIDGDAREIIVIISFFDSYKMYFEKNIIEGGNQDFLRLVKRYLREGINISISNGTLVEHVKKLVNCVKYNPQILETLDAIAVDFLAHCINQPMAGFAVIANLCEIIGAERIIDKLEIAKRIEAMHFITSKAHEILISQSGNGFQGVQIEFGNVMFREVYKMLKNNDKITKEWQAIPQDHIPVEESIAQFNTPQNVELIYNGVLAILDQSINQEFIEKVCAGGIVDVKKDFWALSLIPKDEYSKIRSGLIEAKKTWKDSGYSEEGYQAYKTSSDEFDKSILEKSIEVTKRLFESQRPSVEIVGSFASGIKRSADRAFSDQ